MKGKVIGILILIVAFVIAIHIIIFEVITMVNALNGLVEHVDKISETNLNGLQHVINSTEGMK